MLTVILTGGASRRMGRDKALIPWNGKTMLQNLIDQYSAELGDVAVSVNRPGRFAFTGAAELVDRYPDMGPLNGIVSGFENSDEETIFLTATDLPFGDAGLAKKLCGLISDGDACVIEREGRGVEPVFAVYRRSCLAPAVECLEEGRRSMLRLFDKVRVRYVKESELTDFDLERVLTNVNTPEELEKLK